MKSYKPSEYRRRGGFKVADLTIDRVTYQGPFTGVDREWAMNSAHQHFSGLLNGGSD